MHLGLRRGHFHRTMAQDISDLFEVRASLMGGARPALAQDVRPAGFDATSAKGPADDVAYPVGGQGPAERRPKVDKEQAMLNHQPVAPEIHHQSACDAARQGQESFAPLFGLPQSHGEGAPVHVVQSQCGYFVGAEGQLRKTQGDGVVAPAGGSRTVEGAQEPNPTAGIQNLRGRWEGWASRI